MTPAVKSLPPAVAKAGGPLTAPLSEVKKALPTDDELDSCGAVELEKRVSLLTSSMQKGCMREMCLSPGEQTSFAEACSNLHGDLQKVYDDATKIEVDVCSFAEGFRRFRFLFGSRSPRSGSELGGQSVIRGADASGLRATRCLYGFHFSYFWISTLIGVNQLKSIF